MTTKKIQSYPAIFLLILLKLLLLFDDVDDDDDEAFVVGLFLCVCVCARV